MERTSLCPYQIVGLFWLWIYLSYMQYFDPFAEFIVHLHYILHSSASDQGILITARETRERAHSHKIH